MTKTKKEAIKLHENQGVTTRSKQKKIDLKHAGKLCQDRALGKDVAIMKLNLNFDPVKEAKGPREMLRNKSIDGTLLFTKNLQMKALKRDTIGLLPCHSTPRKINVVQKEVLEKKIMKIVLDENILSSIFKCAEFN